MDNIKYITETIETLKESRDSMDKAISILLGQLRIENSKVCVGTLTYLGLNNGDFVYICDICQRRLTSVPIIKNTICKNNK